MSGDIMTWLVPLVAMLAAGLLAGFAAGIFGIGGGFVVVPALLVVLPLLGGTKDGIVAGASDMATRISPAAASARVTILMIQPATGTGRAARL